MPSLTGVAHLSHSYPGLTVRAYPIPPLRGFQQVRTTRIFESESHAHTEALLGGLRPGWRRSRRGPLGVDLYLELESLLRLGPDEQANVAAAIKAGLGADTETIAAVEAWNRQVGL